MQEGDNQPVKPTDKTEKEAETSQAPLAPVESAKDSVETPAPAPETTEPAETAGTTDAKPEPEPAIPVVSSGGKSTAPWKKSWITVAVVVVVLLAAGAGWRHFGVHHAKPASTTKQANGETPAKQTPAAKAQGVQLDPSKNYGDKYADGVLPVGDGKYVTSSPKTGYVYTCSQYAQNLTAGKGGAMTRGPWFTNNNTEYDTNKKVSVQGKVMWTADFSNKVSGSTRTIVTNDLPSHPTGTFPIANTDPAYQYDRNPNTIQGQTFTYALAANPTYSATPNCMGGEAGIMLTGVALFNAFDAGGRDAGAWEVQDGCQGHPQEDSVYHYHTLSSCIKDISVHTVIGYALDGFPITGPNVGTKNVLTTSDLDECHGLTSQITLDGKSVTMYHYVMTQDFPYSVSCFRGTAITPPDLAAFQQSGSGQGQQPGGQAGLPAGQPQQRPPRQ